MAANNNVPPGSFNANTLAPITVDGIPLDALNDALAAGQQRAPGQRTTQSSQFWSSPRRHITNPTRDIFEIRLSQKHRVNSVSFELANFPFRAEVQCFDTQVSAWIPMYTEEGHPTVLTNETSLPSKIPTLVQQQTKVHPFHHGSGHWIKYNLKVKSVKASRFRIVFTRPFGKPPVDRNGDPLAYPLGVRKFHVSYKIRDRKHVPHKPPHPHHPTWHEPIDSTSDLLGSGVTYSLRENTASDLLRGRMWRSEPQPINTAVVNFYADMRDAQGNPQVTDCIYMDPLYSGVSVSLYYSNDTLPEEFTALTTPVGTVVGTATDPSVETPQGLGLLGDAFVDIDNSNVHFDPTQPWWIGLRYSPNYDSTDPLIYSIFDFLDVTLTVQAGVFTAALDATSVSVTETFPKGQVLSLLVSWDGTTLTLMVGQDSASIDISGDLFPNGAPETLRFFTSQVDETIQGNAWLLDAMIKYGLPSDADIAAFNSDQDSLDAYLNPPEYEEDDTGSTDNSPVRMTFQQIVPGSSPTGFIGGPGNVYSTLAWTPVNRTFKAAKGNFEFPAISAKYLNLEFTNLSPQPYETFQPIYRTIKHLSPDYYPQVSGRYTPQPGGLKTNHEIASSLVFQYGDFTNRSAPRLPVPTSGYTRTQAFYTSDPVTLPKLRNVDPLYGLQRWQPSPQAPTWGTAVVHNYIETTVKQETRTAFFCGLSAFKVYRVQYTADDDTRQYHDRFYDLTHISDSTWAMAVGDLYTDETFSGPVQATSRVFSSRRKVIGVQYATSQSPATQLFADADFNTFNFDGSQNLDHWAPVGDGVVSSSDTYNTDIGTTVRVQRLVPGSVTYGLAHPTLSSGTGDESTTIYDPANYTWGAVTVTHVTWAGIESSGSTWGELDGEDFVIPPPGGGEGYIPGQIIGTPLVGGIQSATYVSPAGSGRLYAAARVVAPRALQVPLWVQIISSELDSDGQPIVLAEKSFAVSGGAVSEFYIGYTVGTGDVDSSNDVGVRVVQKWATGDEWYVDNISLFEDSILWEFSNDGGESFYPVYDIRNDPHGVFIFPPSSSSDEAVGRSLVWRATGYRPDLHLNSLTIRPWYDQHEGPVPTRDISHTTGPQATDYDNYPPIEYDPHWRAWSKPVPVEWWYFYKQWLLLSTDAEVLPQVVDTFLGDSLVVSGGIAPAFTLTEALIY